MVQPKYNAEEALQRVKLMMKYDSTKTLNENFILLEQSEIEKIGGKIWSASYAGGFGTFEDELVNSVLKIKTAQDFWKINEFLKSKSKKDFEQLINDELGSDDANYVKQIADHLTKKLGIEVKNGITSEPVGKTGKYMDKFLGDFKILTKQNVNTQSPESLSQKSQSLTKRQENINKMFCSVVNGIIVAPGSKRNNFKWSDYKSEFKITDQEENIARKVCPKTPKDKNRSKKGLSYTPCKDTYKRGCKSNKIKEVQACLGMPTKYQTGNFGPITQGYLQKLGKGFENGFSDTDVTTICNKQVVPTTTPSVTGTPVTTSTLPDDMPVYDVNTD